MLLNINEEEETITIPSPYHVPKINKNQVPLIGSANCTARHSNVNNITSLITRLNAKWKKHAYIFCTIKTREVDEHVWYPSFTISNGFNLPTSKLNEEKNNEMS